jgi:hypothetical protein
MNMMSGLTVASRIATPVASRAKSGSPGPHTGDVEQIVAEIVERRERYGFSYVQIMEQQMDALAPVVDRLAGT